MRIYFFIRTYFQYKLNNHLIYPAWWIMHCIKLNELILRVIGNIITTLTKAHHSNLSEAKFPTERVGLSLTYRNDVNALASHRILLMSLLTWLRPFMTFKWEAFLSSGGHFSVLSGELPTAQRSQWSSRERRANGFPWNFGCFLSLWVCKRSRCKEFA